MEKGGGAMAGREASAAVNVFSTVNEGGRGRRVMGRYTVEGEGGAEGRKKTGEETRVMGEEEVEVSGEERNGGTKRGSMRGEEVIVVVVVVWCNGVIWPSVGGGSFSCVEAVPAVFFNGESFGEESGFSFSFFWCGKGRGEAGQGKEDKGPPPAVGCIMGE